MNPIRGGVTSVAWMESPESSPSSVPQEENETNGALRSALMLKCVVFACNEAYAMPLATAMQSLLESRRSREPLAICVLSDGIRPETQQRIGRSMLPWCAAIEWIPVDSTVFEQYGTLSYVSRTTYARLRIADLLPSTVERVLYLDADLLVLDDIDRLMDIELDGCVLAAATDGLDRKRFEDPVRFAALPKVQKYFNAGVLLIDLQQWRREQIAERAFAFLDAFPSSPYSDQDALNVACDGQWKQLDPRWNYQECHESSIADLAQRPGIAHFIMSAKPWDARVRNVNASFYDTFRSRTCFARSAKARRRDAALRMLGSLKRFVKRARKAIVEAQIAGRTKDGVTQ